MIDNKAELLSRDIEEKVEYSKEIIREAFLKFKPQEMAIAITGGKDSTTNLWLFREVCNEAGYDLPVCMFIDEGDVFDEIEEFVNGLKKDWALDIVRLKNEDVSSRAASIGGIVTVSSLNENNQAALREMDFGDAEFSFVPDSPVCNHLMKTIPMRDFIIKNDIKAVATAIRWDEQTAREQEEFYAPRSIPDHTRIHPILHFKERDIWIAIFKYGIPYNSLYRLGYRSLGARCATGKDSDIPAWMQDLEDTPERVGRGQDKEQVMDQLRALGYM